MEDNVIYRPEFYQPCEAGLLFFRLMREIPWTQGQVRVFGKIHNEPRLTSWHAKSGEGSYTYSGKTNQIHSFTPVLIEICKDLRDQGRGDYNSVLCNLYRDGNDYVSWHSDDESMLDTSSIVSLSFGATRRFLFREKEDHSKKTEFQLASGDLIQMYGDCQRRYQHHVPKQAGVHQVRVNLTFRRVK